MGAGLGAVGPGAAGDPPTRAPAHPPHPPAWREGACGTHPRDGRPPNEDCSRRLLQPPRPAEAHRQLLSVDRSGGAGADSSHILVPVDDTDVRCVQWCGGEFLLPTPCHHPMPTNHVQDSEAAIDFSISNFKDSTFHLLHVVPEPQVRTAAAATSSPPRLPSLQRSLY